MAARSNRMSDQELTNKSWHTHVYDSARTGMPLFNELREVWRYRFLVRNLIGRDLKVRYKRSVLGFLWVMLNPLLQMAVMYFVFQNIFRFQIQHYATFLLSGILLYNMFQQSTFTALSAVVASGPILRKLYVPPSAFVVSVIGSAVVNMIFSVGPLLLIAVLNGVYPAVTWGLLPLGLILMTVLSLGVGFLLATMYVFFRDLGEIYQVLVMVLYFATPIIYPTSILPTWLQGMEVFNPLFLIINSFRLFLMQGALPPASVMIASVSMPVGVLVVGWFIFAHTQSRFAYYL